MTAPPIRDFSEESHSTTMSEGLARALRYTNLTEPTTTVLREEHEDLEESENPAARRLKRALSIRSIISTTSSFAARMQRVASEFAMDRENLRVIGLGSCGTVFEIPGTQLAFKKGTNERGIWQDFCLTNKVFNAIKHVRTMLQDAFPDFEIPRAPLCHEYHPADDEKFWSANLQRFPAGYRSNQPIFTVDRVLPLTEQTRTDLIEMYFDEAEEIQREAKTNQDNKDCLVRVYLGERESVLQQTGVYDTLRNFPLRLNMMEDLDVDVALLTNEIAIGLAIMHWQAQVDGMDVEYVLGSSATWNNEQPKGYDDESSQPHTVEVVNFKRRAVQLWMLDFDKATRINLDNEDVDRKLVPAFLGNDPYYPRPNIDEELWQEFSITYLKASEIILRSKGVGRQVMGLPQRFLHEVVRVSAEHEDWNEEDNIVFRD